MVTINDKEKIILFKKKVKAYFDNKLDVHLTLNDGEWLNAEIKDISNEEFFLINENKKGEMPVFYAELYDITKREEKK